MRKDNVSFNVKGYVDRRTPQLKGRGASIVQARADDAIEREWRRRVAANPIERNRLARERAAGVLGNAAK